MPADTPLSAERALLDCKVVSISCLANDIYLMRLRGAEIAANAKPGQFVNLKTNVGPLPLWRRPFSICRRDVAAGWFEVLWKVVGPGTLALSQLHVGDTLSAIGPLGRGFSFSDESELAILVAGGIGVAALPFLCEEIAAAGIGAEVFLGARNSHELVFVDFFERLAMNVTLVTEDGSAGQKGLVTAPLQARLAGIRKPAGTRLFSCGPPAFLQAMAAITAETGIEGQVAVETRMACGFGICVGCAMRVREPADGQSRYKLVCLDGPVFDARELEFDDGS